MFRTPLNVVHTHKKDWKLTTPLVYEGESEYLIIRSGFLTDFASIPRPVRWLLDNAGRNAEAAVLHDAVWRESKLPNPRIDPWDADGMFRRALRETGSTALARGVMWLAVRIAAMADGRIGKRGPALPIKLLQLVGIFVLALITVIPTTVVAIMGLVGYWLTSWLAAIVWFVVFERRHATDGPNWPWPFHRRQEQVLEPYGTHLLVIIPKPAARAGADRTLPTPEDDRRCDLLEERLAEPEAFTGEDVDRLIEQAVLVDA